MIINDIQDDDIFADFGSEGAEDLIASLEFDLDKDRDQYSSDTALSSAAKKSTVKKTSKKESKVLPKKPEIKSKSTRTASPKPKLSAKPSPSVKSKATPKPKADPKPKATPKAKAVTKATPKIEKTPAKKASKPKEQFVDPLGDLDPIMEMAFSASEPSIGQNPPRSEQLKISLVDFPEASDELDQDLQNINSELFRSIPVTVSVELGRTHLALKDIYELMEGSIIELDRLVGEPLDLMVADQIIAQGEVVAIDNKYGLRIKRILSEKK